jgi:hypothetical protein
MSSILASPPQARHPAGAARDGRMRLLAIGWGLVALLPVIAAVLVATEYGDYQAARDQRSRLVTDAEFATAALRFPVNPPLSREAYLYRTLFERVYPGDACARSVPGGRSIACSTPAALVWDAAFAAAADPSGRAVAGVHTAAHAVGAAVAEAPAGTGVTAA